MGKKIAIDVFDIDTINNAIKELTAYKDSITAKCEQFCERMMELGYTIAMSKVEGVDGLFGTHKMENYVFFTISTQPNSNGCESYLLGLQKPFESTWKSGDEMHTAIVYPLEMLEFGSAGYAISPGKAMERFGVYSGKGSMAIAGNQSKKTWGNNNNWSAIKPTMPMYSAYAEMMRNVDKIAKEVFRQ